MWGQRHVRWKGQNPGRGKTQFSKTQTVGPSCGRHWSEPFVVGFCSTMWCGVVAHRTTRPTKRPTAARTLRQNAAEEAANQLRASMAPHLGGSAHRISTLHDPPPPGGSGHVACDLACPSSKHTERRNVYCVVFFPCLLLPHQGVPTLPSVPPPTPLRVVRGGAVEKTWLTYIVSSPPCRHKGFVSLY